MTGLATRQPSRLSWVDTLPSHWQVGNIRRFATMKSGHTPSRAVSKFWENVTIPWFTLADVWQLRDGTRMYLGKTASRISDLGLDNSAAELLPAGTVVLSRTASVGFTGVMPCPMATSQDFWNWVCRPELIPEYLAYVFRAMREEFNAVMVGSTHKTIYQATAAGLRIPVPPSTEQRQIVEYLVHSTAHIDVLIAKQERLIENLYERRSSTLAAALDSTPAATSGLRLKHLVDSVVQGWSPQCYGWPADGIETWGVLKAGAANGGVFRPTENKQLPQDMAPRPELAVRLGHLVVSRANTRQLVGSAAAVENEYPRLMLCDKLYAFTLNETKALPKFVALVLGTRRWRDLIELCAVGASSSMQNISQADIVNLPMDLPLVSDQTRILKEVAEASSKVDALIAKAKEFIALARERRAALITEAVTGRIDMSTGIAHEGV